MKGGGSDPLGNYGDKGFKSFKSSIKLFNINAVVFNFYQELHPLPQLFKLYPTDLTPLSCVMLVWDQKALVYWSMHLKIANP